MQKNKVEVSPTKRTVYVPLCVNKNGKSYTVSCSDPAHEFRCYIATQHGLARLGEQLDKIFKKITEEAKLG